MNENAQLLITLEDTLLFELSSSHGNILDNHELIATLDNTKTKAIDISHKLTLAETTKNNISIARSEYKPVAKRGSIIYFAEASLATISTMYELSLDSFLSIFNTALHLSPPAGGSGDINIRIINMINTIMSQLYDYTCTGIFECHKLMFSFQLTCMIQDGEGLLDQTLLDFFLKGNISLESVTETCIVTWLIETGWKDLVYISKIYPIFNEIYTHFISAPELWKAWFDLEAPEACELPSNKTTSNLNPLQKLCIIRCFRPDRVYNAVKLYVIEILGEKYIQPPVLDYHRIYLQSSPLSPMVFILSPGADPQADIQKYSDNMNMTSKFKFVALGQGQGPIAEQLLEIGLYMYIYSIICTCILYNMYMYMHRNMHKQVYVLNLTIQ